MVCGKRNQDQELLLSAAKSTGTVYPVCTGGRPADGTAAAKCRYPDREERSAYLAADQHHTGYAVGIGECAMLYDLPAGQQVYLITGYTDLRRSIDGLASIIQGQLNLDPFSTARMTVPFGQQEHHDRCGQTSEQPYEVIEQTVLVYKQECCMIDRHCDDRKNFQMISIH